MLLERIRGADLLDRHRPLQTLVDGTPDHACAAATNLLDQAVTENGLTDPGEILNQLHRGVLQALRQGYNEVSTQDGMDVSIIALDPAGGTVRWAGANRPLIVVSDGGRLSRYDGTKSPVGGVQGNPERVFKTHVIAAAPGSTAYLFSDGYADQFGGEKGKKFMAKRFYEVLQNIQDLSPGEKKHELEKRFDQWRAHHEQVDDVLVAGIEI